MGQRYERMKKAAAEGKAQAKPKLKHSLMPSMGKPKPVPKATCRRCGQGFPSAAERDAHDCPVQKKHFSAEARDYRVIKHGRLPVGSRYECVYHDGMWECKLTVPLEGVSSIFFHATGDGLFRTEELLDAKYREWLDSQPRRE